MEDEKKKKKKKKKKNKQAKTAEDVAVGIEGSASADQTVNGFEQDHQGPVFETADIPNDVPKSDMYLDRHHTSGSEDVSLEEQIKQLQKDKDAYINKEVDLGLKISQLQNEKDFWHQKETSLEEQIKQLQEEKDVHISKEADYKQKISQLVNEASTTSLKEVGLQEKIKQLEKERESWAQKENFIEGTIAGLNADNTRLHSKPLEVMELEESLKNLLQENQQLIETMSGLQSQIQNSAHLSTVSSMMRASINEDMKSEMLAAQTMIKKLISENAELVEKLKAEHDQKGATAELSSSVGPDPTVCQVAPALVEGLAIASDQMDGTAERFPSVLVAEISARGPDPIAGTTERLAGDIIDDPLFESSERPSLLGEKMMSIENDVGNHANHKNPDVLPNDETIIVSEEIVQIPLDENEVGVTKLEVEDSCGVETADVPISDAPLIGAPFRLISFVARYVSGADLVDKSHLKSGR